MAGDLAGWEHAWLDWARPIVSCVAGNPAYFEECIGKIGNGGYVGSGADDPTLRWPGYVGSGWG